MKRSLFPQWLPLVLAFVMATLASALAQEGATPPSAPTSPSPKADPAAAPASSTAGTVQAQAPGDKVSPGIAEILRMVDAKVSNDVIRLYVETSPVAYFLSAQDVIALKQHGVADEIVTALLKRGAEIRAQASPASAGGDPSAANVPAAAAAPSVMRSDYGVLDPNSYAYFYTYYLHPRTLASVYQRLGVYGSPYLNGYYPPFPAYSFGYAPHLGLTPTPRVGGFQRSLQPWR